MGKQSSLLWEWAGKEQLQGDLQQEEDANAAGSCRAGFRKAGSSRRCVSGKARLFFFSQVLPAPRLLLRQAGSTAMPPRTHPARRDIPGRNPHLQ